jgi:purine catabolism regulator
MWLTISAGLRRGEWAIDQWKAKVFVHSSNAVDVEYVMELRLSDILADPELGLKLADGSPDALARHVRWVAVTELADPRPFLSGRELVLTTGLAQRTAAAQRDFVARIAERDVAGLGFGTRLTHNVVPAATLAAARSAGLPVLEVPYSTPFIAVDRFVADRILEEQYGRFHDLVVEQDTLARSLLSGQGLSALVDSLRRILGAPVAVVDPQDNLLAGRLPASADPTVLPVEIEDRVVAYLRCGRPQRSSDVLPYAVALVGLELSRREAVLAGRRQLAGQVLEDLVRSSITTAEAERRLATFGIRAGDDHALVVGTVDLAGEDLRRHLAASPMLPGATTAVLEDCLVAVLGPGGVPQEAAEQMYANLSRRGGGEARVGIGGWYGGMTGLRWSYYEAQEAMSRGAGINERQQMSLSGLLLASEDVPMRELAEDLLRPLREFDEQHSGPLVATLRAYLDANGSVAAVADRLIVHRNTVRYRLEQIERLIGQPVDSTATQVQLWLALAAIELRPRRTPG